MIVGSQLKTHFVKRQWLFRLPFAVKPTVDGRKFSNFVHFLARLLVRHTHHDLEKICLLLGIVSLFLALNIVAAARTFQVGGLKAKGVLRNIGQSWQLLTR